MVRHPFRARPRIESSASRDEGAPTSLYSCKSIDIIAPDATAKSPGGFYGAGCARGRMRTASTRRRRTACRMRARGRARGVYWHPYDHGAMEVPHAAAATRDNAGRPEAGRPRLGGGRAPRRRKRLREPARVPAQRRRRRPHGRCGLGLPRLAPLRLGHARGKPVAVPIASRRERRHGMDLPHAWASRRARQQPRDRQHPHRNPHPQPHGAAHLRLLLRNAPRRRLRGTRGGGGPARRHHRQQRRVRVPRGGP